jgi:16S rRNA (adenine1518-N6/adenine1519-N6)-dimethyltransferase
MSALDDLPPLREVVATHGLAARKSLGQNFLFDLNLTARIARAAGPLDEATICEIGPGPGGLTRALLACGARRVVAVERDERCLAALAEIAARYPGRLEVIAGDALETDLAALAGPGPTRICANLPYNIGTALLVGWLESPVWPPFWDRLVLMFQREVAERIVASPKERADYGRLAVLANWRCETRILFDVPIALGRHAGRLRAAAQDVAPEPQGSRRRGRRAAGDGRHRADAAGRGSRRRRLRRAGARARGFARRLIIPTEAGRQNRPWPARCAGDAAVRRAGWRGDCRSSPAGRR